ncbi:hypothetical protein THAOC_15827 [Thalassiosira oceanica]|uniref:DUF7640 domain-containing protein n=1 Tax=Thalassiosira oceanica TaxID=159749 RepID=K0SET5_THAOC|nr:hypothetical protein THAOC_15827 [Thalassiosira oceanica]|eukprot:EJK63504.1 hypothetical protein THAOC_15827 [Thalassiosira oceanica]
MRVNQAAVNALACAFGTHSAAASRAEERRAEKKLEKIAARRNDASKKSGATIDDGLMGRSAKAKSLVDCIDGNTVKVPGVTCEEACGGECCVGDDSCKGFTGSVAKDGSCDGEEACRNAKIGEVSGGSCDGNSACQGATISVVSDGSCKNPGACFRAEISVVSGGSCDGNSACYYAEIGVVSGQSCVGVGGYACSNAKAQSITKSSCTYFSACQGLGRFGNVDNLVASCGEKNACYKMAYKGSVGDVKNSCNNGIGEDFPLISSAPSPFLSPTITLCRLGNCRFVAYGSSDTVTTIVNCCNDSDLICDGAASDDELIEDDQTCKAKAGKSSKSSRK